MAKLFNNEIIDYLRDTSRKSKFDPNEFEPGETFIAQQPGAKRDNDPIRVEPTSEGHPNCKINEPQNEPSSSVGSKTCPDDDDECETLKGAGDARTLHEIDDFLVGITPKQMNQFCAKCSRCSKLGAPIRRILGPFPDEPIMAAVDKFLTIIGITLGGKEDEMAVEDEESDTLDEETEGLDSCTAEDVETADD